jgi:hypothetical protein
VEFAWMRPNASPVLNANISRASCDARVKSSETPIAQSDSGKGDRPPSAVPHVQSGPDGWLTLCDTSLLEEVPMNHRGVEYSIVVGGAPGIWKWQFRIGDKVKSGRTETKLNLLAIRRVQLRIDQELRKSGQGATA